MNINELDYDYPKELVATTPASPRDSAKLLVFDKKTGKITHSKFSELGHHLVKGDVLVLNKTKVFKARLFVTDSENKKLEIVFLKEIVAGEWEIMAGRGVKDGMDVTLPDKSRAKVGKKPGLATLLTDKSRLDIFELLERFGHVPLPPYIKRTDNNSDVKEYQSVFAKETGSAAAPTAGLHFTTGLLTMLKNRGIEIEYITLHVGLGTFAPVRTETVEDHPIHTEYFEIDESTANRLNQAKDEGRRVIACGTTVVRTLESAFCDDRLIPQKSETSLFIYPGYQFGIVDGIITNFHTPRSSLLALVYAFAGQKNIKGIYETAISKKYRLFSYGDGMLLL